MAPLQEFTISGNTTVHANPGVLCTPAHGTTILVFYIANYLAHVATVKSYPAETVTELSVAVMLAFFFPSSGIIRALDSIFRHSRLMKANELQKAARAGALCMVVRSKDWTPMLGDVIRGIELMPKRVENSSQPSELSEAPSRERLIPEAGVESIEMHSIFQVNDPTMVEQRQDITEHLHSPDGKYVFEVQAPSWLHENIRTNLTTRRIEKRGCKIHGVYSMVPGYELTYVPSDAVMDSGFGRRFPSSRPNIEISSTYNAPKTAVSVAQTIYAAITLYQTRGNQIELYGYAAFGLTVTPYIIMSILNLVGQLATADYSTLYMVHSEEMDEARRRGAHFDGVVGKIKLAAEPGEPWTVEEGADRNDFRLRRGTTAATTSRTRSARTADTVRNVRIRPARGSEDESFVKIRVPSCSQFKRTSPPTNMPSSWSSKQLRIKSRAPLIFWAPLAFGLVSLLIIGLMSRFRTGRSTKAQRAWIMSWLVVGMIMGSMSNTMSNTLIPRHSSSTVSYCSYLGHMVGFVALFGICLAPAVGGIVVVGQMISSYGKCIRI